MSEIRVLFVCTGNICRSPSAEGIFRHQLQSTPELTGIDADSAGTHSYHLGHSPDSRAIETLAGRGVDISSLRARRVSEQDFENFQLIIAMDDDNMAALRDRAPSGGSEVRLFLDFSSGPEREVPDPYYGGAAGFERVLDLVEDASQGLIDHIRRRQLRSGRG